MPTQEFSLNQNYIDSTLIPALNTVVLATECGGNPAYISKFSFAGSNSSYSFGLYQFDVKSNPNAQSFLAQLGFSAGQIALLSQNGGLSQSQLSNLDAQLSEALQNPANATAIQALNNSQASVLVVQLQNLLNVVGQNNPNIASQIYGSQDFQLRILDYANQFGISPNGPLESWLSNLSSSTQLTDAMFQNYVMSTAYGKEFPNPEATREGALNAAINSLQNNSSLGAASEYYDAVFQEAPTSQLITTTSTGDAWTNAIGTNGTDTYNADGSSNSKVTYADGNYATTLDDGQGNITTDYYTKDGIEIRSTWVHSDGSSGTVNLYADGQTQIPGAGTYSVPQSSFTVLQNPDGTYTTTGWNAQDTSTTTHFAASGGQTSQSTGTGSGINDQTVASSKTAYISSFQEVVTYNDNAAGAVIGDSWYAANPDGSANPNGVYLGWANATATSGTTTDNASGVIVKTATALDGSEYRDTIEFQGDTVTHLTSGGTLLSDTWTLTDGTNTTPSVTGSDTFNADGSGSGTFSDLRDNTAGTVTLTSQGDITVVNTNAGGTVTSEDIWNASNSTYEIAMLSSTGTTLGVYNYLANGNVTVTDYASDGTTIADQQTEAAGLVVNPDGSSFSKVANANGSYTVYYQNASGDTTAYQYSASGQLTSSYHTTSYDYQHADWSGTLADGSTWTGTLNDYTPTFTDAQGNAWTWYLNAAGVETGADYVNAALGTHGYITYGANGAAYEVDYAANGTYTTISQDGLGDVTDTFFNASGTETGDSWKTANGAHGGDTYNADGSSSGTSINADGSYGSYTDDGKGDMVSAEYSAAGVMLSEVWTNANGTSGNETFNADGSTVTTSYNADGSYTVTNNDGKGDITQAHYTSAGVETSDAWQKANGTKGSDTFFAPGSAYNLLAEGQTTNPDGSSSQYQTILNSSNLVETDTTFYASGGVVSGTSKRVNNGNGTATINSYSASGTLTETMTDTLSSAGAVTSDTWTKADGSSGSDTFNADGSSSGTTINTDGSTSAYANDGQGDITTDSYKASGVLSAVAWSGGDPYVTTTSSTQAAGSVTTTSTNARDHSGIVTTTDTNGSSIKTISDGRGDTTTDNFSASNVLTSDSWTQANGTSGSDVYNADGSSSSTVNDGQGDSTTDNYSASGVLMSDSWSKSDGTHGSDTYNTNGSSSSASYNANGSYTTTSDDGQGNLTRDTYTSAGTLQSTSWEKSDGTFGYTNYVADGSVVSTFNSGNVSTAASGISDPFLAAETSAVTVTPITQYGGEVVGQIWHAANGDYGRDSIDGQSIVFHSDGSFSAFDTQIYSFPVASSSLTNYSATGAFESQQWSQVAPSAGSRPAYGAFGQSIANSDGSTTERAYVIGGDSAIIQTDSSGNFSASGIDQGNSFAATKSVSGKFSITDGELAVNGVGNMVTSTNANINLSTLSMSGSLYQFGTLANGDKYSYYNQPGATAPYALGLPYVSASSGSVQSNVVNYYNNSKNNNIDINQLSGAVNGVVVGLTPVGYAEVGGDAMLGVIGNSVEFSLGYSAIYSSPTNLVAPAGFSVKATQNGDTWSNSSGMHGTDTNVTGSIVGGSDLQAINSQYSGSGEFIGAGEKNQFYAADGSSITTTMDINNDVIIDFNGNNGVLSAALEMSDTTHVTQTYGAAINQIAYYYDGSSTSYFSDAQGNIDIKQFGASGNLTSDYWSSSNGTYGSDYFDANGQVENFVYQADGSYSEKIAFGANDTETENYNSSGVLISDNWEHPDGSSGTDIYNADGSSSSSTTNANGTTTTSNTDTSGDTYTNTYSAAGALLSNAWSLANGTSGSNVYNSAGTLTEATWTNTDGSFGSTTYNTDGSYTTAATTATGNTSTDNYTAAGVLTSDTWRDANGTSGADTYNSGGLTSQSTWTNPDGSTGSNTVVGNAAVSLTFASGTNTIALGSGIDTLQTTGGTNPITLGQGTAILSNSGATDTVALGASVNPDQLWFAQSGTDLVVSVLGSTENLTVKDWFNGLANQVSAFVAGNGQTLSGSNVDQLVQAMAAFSPPTSSQTAYTTAEATNLDPVIAANWH